MKAWSASYDQSIPSFWEINIMNVSEEQKKALVDANPGDIINLKLREEVEGQQIDDDPTQPILDRIPPICRSKGQHPKQHACLPAKFTINPNLDEKLRIGVFSKDKTYDAWVRFSNSRTMDDTKRGTLGLAIKLNNIDEDGSVQDFLLINSPIFFASKVNEYMDVINFFRIEAKSEKLNFFLKKNMGLLKSLFNGLFRIQKAKRHPLSQKYWSAAPFKHGEGYNVKYILEPTEPAKNIKAKSTGNSNALTEFLVYELSHENAVFKFNFYLQVSDKTLQMPINDFTKKWVERKAGTSNQNMFHAATLTFLGCPELAQNIIKTQEFGEKLSFSPGNCLPEHEPMGELNIVRKHVYAEVAKKRRAENWGITTTTDGTMDGTTAGAWPMPQENPTEELCPFHQSEN